MGRGTRVPSKIIALGPERLWSNCVPSYFNPEYTGRTIYFRAAKSTAQKSSYEHYYFAMIELIKMGG